MAAGVGRLGVVPRSGIGRGGAGRDRLGPAASERILVRAPRPAMVIAVVVLARSPLPVGWGAAAGVLAGLTATAAASLVLIQVWIGPKEDGG